MPKAANPVPVAVSSRLAAGPADQRTPAWRAAGQAGKWATGTGIDQVFPLCDQLRPLMPWYGLRRGATVAVMPGVPGATSVLLSLIAEPVRAGSWGAVVGMPDLGIAAAAESGVDLARLVLVPDPGAEWATVTAALLDGLDIVAVCPPGQVAPRLAHRLAARARQRGGVLISFGEWDRADVVLRTTGQAWQGLGAGRGRLRGRELTLVANGRGAAVRPRKTSIWLPVPGTAPTGTVPDTQAAPALVGDLAMTEVS